MSKVTYFSFLCDLTNPGRFRGVAYDGASEPVEVSAEDLSQVTNCVITHDSWMIADAFSFLGLPLPENIFDLGIAKKKTVGISKADLDESSGLPWESVNLFSNKYESFDSFIVWEKCFWSGARPENTYAILASHARAIMASYRDLVASLDRDVLTSLCDVEMPVHNIFLRRQWQGISVDHEITENILSEIDDEYFTILADLKYKYFFEGGAYDHHYIKSYLYRNDVGPVNSLQEMSLDKYIQYHKDYDGRLLLIWKLRKLRVTKNALLKGVNSRSGRIHPIFDTFGTVTGRIQVVEPLLQHLKKEYRTFFKESSGGEQVYIDFCQFEPSILAFLSGDKTLISLINKGDLYNFISDTLFGGAINRKVAKVLFIQYMYGAGDSTLSNYVDKLREYPIDSRETVSGMRAMFSEVDAWREQVFETVRNQGYLYGDGMNIRRLKKRTDINGARAKRQMVNHLIQSAGSELIKDIILKIERYDDRVKTLIPMFDALFLEVPIGSRDAVSEIFYEAFQERFPGINARLSVTRFDDTPL